ncbi:acyl-CoA dehydrogenase family protein [Streptomyces sp. NPDC008343]|uniref:acyl-CoA dehydrogenase family protein n=1 Tax=Streptomyces sp. NPDC008343 TaxID=3364828 RepID=UPI0036E6B1DA
MRRAPESEEQHGLREAVREFIAREVVPHHDRWEEQGHVDRKLWLTAGKGGFLGFDVPEQYGGGGSSDFRLNAILNEELVAVGASGPGFTLHNDVVAPYLLELATPEQRDTWLAGFCSGEVITAIAMTEPGAGSDLRGIRTKARRTGSGWLLSGSKTFITNGLLADLVVVAAVTDEGRLSLFLVPAGTPGFSRGQKLDKIGLAAQDTAELYFDRVEVGPEALLGEVGMGLDYLKANLPRERLSISVRAVASARRALDLTVAYCKEREAFGRPIGDFQAVRFALAEAATQVDVATQYVDAQIDALNEGSLTAVDAAMGKWWTTDLERRVADSCLQLHGGYGYMREQPIARLYLDARIQPIYGGTNEIMKHIIGAHLMRA